MTSPDEPQKPQAPADKPQAPAPTPIVPTSPLDQIKDTIIDDIGAFTRIKIPGMDLPGVGPPGGTKFD